MWTPATRRQHSREALRYGTDLTTREWRVIEAHLPAACEKGRPRAWPEREIVNAIFYVLRGGIAWRLQERQYGGLPAQTVRELGRIAASPIDLGAGLRAEISLRILSGPRSTKGIKPSLDGSFARSGVGRGI